MITHIVAFKSTDPVAIVSIPQHRLFICNRDMSKMQNGIAFELFTQARANHKYTIRSLGAVIDFNNGARVPRAHDWDAIVCSGRHLLFFEERE